MIGNSTPLNWFVRRWVPLMIRSATESSLNIGNWTVILGNWTNAPLGS